MASTIRFLVLVIVNSYDALFETLYYPLRKVLKSV